MQNYFIYLGIPRPGLGNRTIQEAGIRTDIGSFMLGNDQNQVSSLNHPLNLRDWPYQGGIHQSFRSCGRCFNSHKGKGKIH